jgi:hypothetical protein
MSSNNDDFSTAGGVGDHGRPWILATWPEGRSVHCELPSEGSIVVGRGSECDLVVPHPSVSRRHARLSVGPPLAVEDLGSANGTKVRGHRLGQGVRALVEHGVAIEIGDVALIVRTVKPEEPAALPPTRSASLNQELATIERDRIVEALARCGGNQTRAAAALGISRRTLVNRIAEYDLPRPLKGSR